MPARAPSRTRSWSTTDGATTEFTADVTVGDRRRRRRAETGGGTRRRPRLLIGGLVAVVALAAALTAVANRPGDSDAVAVELGRQAGPTSTGQSFGVALRTTRAVTVNAVKVGLPEGSGRLYVTLRSPEGTVLGRGRAVGSGSAPRTVLLTGPVSLPSGATVLASVWAPRLTSIDLPPGSVRLTAPAEFEVTGAFAGRGVGRPSTATDAVVVMPLVVQSGATPTPTPSTPTATSSGTATSTPSPTVSPSGGGTSAPPPAPVPPPTSGNPPVPAPDGLAVPAPGAVGYRGAAAALKVIDSTGSAPAGTSWTGKYLEVSGNDVVLDTVYVKGGIQYVGRGTLTIRNSIIEGGGAWFVISHTSSGCRVDVRDSTLRWKAGSLPPQAIGAGAMHGDCSVTAIRNDISGTPDGIQTGPGDSLYQQNYIHDLALMGTYPNNTHNDGIQLYGGARIKILYNRIDIGFDGEHQNAAVFLQPGGDNTISSPEIVGNYLSGGGFALRLEGRTTNAVIKDNVFGPRGKGWGEAYIVSGATASVWQNNATSRGTAVPKP